MSRLVFFPRCNGMPPQTGDEKGIRLSVRPPVCLSVKRVDCGETEDRSMQIFAGYERSFSLVFWEEEWFVEKRPLSP